MDSKHLFVSGHLHTRIIDKDAYCLYVNAFLFELPYYFVRLVVFFAQSIDARCQVENEDVVGSNFTEICSTGVQFTISQH